MAVATIRGHSHIDFIALHVVFGDGFELCSRSSRQEFVQNGHPKLGVGPVDKQLQICLGNSSNGIDVSTRTIVFGQVTSQAFVNVGAAQHQKTAADFSCPRQQAGEHVAQHHSQTGADVAKGQVFGDRPAKYLEDGFMPRSHFENRHNSRHQSVHVHIDMVRADRVGQLFGSGPRFFGRVLGSHERSVEQKACNFAGFFRNEVWLLCQRLDVCDDLLVAFAASLDHQTTHQMDNDSCSARIDASTQRKEESGSLATPQVVPQPARRSQCDLLLGQMVLDGNCSRRSDQWVEDIALSRLAVSVRSDVIQVDGCADHLDVFQREAGGASDHFSVDNDAGTPVVVEPVAVAAPAVRVDVDTTALLGGLHDQAQSGVQFTQAVVGARRVGEYFHAVKSHGDMRRVWGEQLFASLGTYSSLAGLDYAVAKLDGFAPRYILHALGQKMVLPVLFSVPGSEEPHFPVVSVVCKVQFGPDKQYLAVIREDSTVVLDRFVDNRHANVNDNAVGVGITQNLGVNLPRVVVKIRF